ncbi:unnamed protein product, partial [Heterosigma akashiwo]
MVAAVKEGGLLAKSIQDGVGRSRKTASFDLVTEGDIKCQALLIEKLLKIFPGVPYVPEEKDVDACSEGMEFVDIEYEKNQILGTTFLTIDPIDGTSNYASGSPDWGQLACYVEDGLPNAAVLHMPLRSTTFSARRGRGCVREEEGGGGRRRGRVWIRDEARRLADVLVGAEVHPLIEEGRLHRLARLMTGRHPAPGGARALGVRNLSSSVGNLVDLLEGHTGAFVHLRGASVWDLAAGALAVEEAGGFCCDLRGRPLRWDRLKVECVMAVSEGLAREIVAALGI